MKSYVVMILTVITAVGLLYWVLPDRRQIVEHRYNQVFDIHVVYYLDGSAKIFFWSLDDKRELRQHTNHLPASRFSILIDTNEPWAVIETCNDRVWRITLHARDVQSVKGGFR